MGVRVSRPAAWYLRRQGGRLYVWARPVSSRAALLRHTTGEPPPEVDFDRITHEGLELYFETGLGFRWVEIEATLFPPGVEVIWDGTQPAAGGCHAFVSESLARLAREC